MMSVLFRRPDGTFVILKNGLPYHVVQGDPLFGAVSVVGQSAPLEPAPTPEPEPSGPPNQVTALQFIRALAVAPSAYPPPLTGARTTGWITEDEARQWMRRVDLPAAAAAAIAALPAEQRVDAEFSALGMTVALRSSPFLTQAMALLGATDEDRDRLFRFAATLFED